MSVFSVETRTVGGAVTAVGSAGPFTRVVDRPVEAGGGGKGFNGGQLLYLAVAGCISNDLFREAPALGVKLESVRISVDGDFAGDPAVSGPIRYHVDVTSGSDPDRVRELVELVDRIAEIPNSLRQGTQVALGKITVGS
jgi:putative redox protein